MQPTIEVSTAWYRERWADYARRWTWSERLGATALLAGLAATWWFSRKLTFTPMLLLWGGWLVASAAYLHHRKVRFFGPVCFHDLVRTGRQSRYTLLRTAYVVVLLVTLSTTYTDWFGGGLAGLFTERTIHARDMALFAESFFFTFAWVQFLAALVFTPIAVASGLTEEKERGTLEGILSTDLEDQEIVLGKLASRVAHLLLVLLAGLPVLTATQFLGGVDPGLVLLAFAVTGLTILSLSSLAILCSVYRKHIAEAVFITYLVLGSYFALTFVVYGITYAVNNLITLASYCLSLVDAPFGLPDWLACPHPNFGNPLIGVWELDSYLRAGMRPTVALQEVMLEVAVFQALIIAWCCRRAVLKLRPLALRTEAPLPVWRRPGIEFPPRRNRRRLGNGNPLLWKEMHADAPIGSAKFSALVMYLFLVMGWCLAAFFVFTLWVDAAFYHGIFDDTPFDWRALRLHANTMACNLGTFLASIMLLAVAFYAAGAVSRERERRTLDALLTLPCDRREILWAKWLGTILAVRPLWWCLGTIWVLGTLTGGLHFAALPLLLLAWATFASFACGLGMWCSLYFRNTLQATMATLLIIFGLLFVCRLGAMNGELLWLSWLPADLAMEVTRLFDEGLFPPIALARLSFHYDEGPRNTYGAASAPALRAIAIALVIYAAASWALWRANLRRFTQMVAG